MARNRVATMSQRDTGVSSPTRAGERSETPITPNVMGNRMKAQGWMSRVSADSGIRRSRTAAPSATRAKPTSQVRSRTPPSA